MPADLVPSSRTFFADETPRAGGRLTLAGAIHRSAGVSTNPMRVLGRFALVLLMHGRGFYADARGAGRAVGAGDTILVLPELPHAYGPRPSRARGGVWDELHLCFDGSLFELWRREGLLDDSTLVRAAPDPRAMFARLLALCEAPRPSDAASHGAQLRELLAILAELFPPRDAQSDEPLWMGRARSLLDSNLDHPLGGRDAARAAQMSYSAFRRAWTAATGLSPARYRDEKRLEAAQILLAQSTMTQGQIARSLGWRDEAHLSRRFRQLRGQSIRQWKASASRG